MEAAQRRGGQLDSNVCEATGGRSIELVEINLSGCKSELSSEATNIG